MGSCACGAATPCLTGLESWSCGGQRNTNPIKASSAGYNCFETYDAQGLFQSRRMAEIQFAVIVKGTFEQLAFSAGFSVAALYGDYAYTKYSPSSARI